jgi:hypothetical protein
MLAPLLALLLGTQPATLDVQRGAHPWAIIATAPPADYSSVSWDFGDGTAITLDCTIVDCQAGLQQPHEYARNDTYTVTFTANQETSISADVRVPEPLEVNCQSAQSFDGQLRPERLSGAVPFRVHLLFTTTWEDQGSGNVRYSRFNLAPHWTVDPADGSPPTVISRNGPYVRDDPDPRYAVDYGNGLKAEWQDTANTGRLFWPTDHVYLRPGTFRPTLGYELTNPTTGQIGLSGSCSFRVDALVR